MSQIHTPGPWTTDEQEHHEPHQDIKIKANKHHTVCTLWIDDAPVRDFNSAQKANARLIAAAPDLLEALQWAMSEIEALNINRDLDPSHNEAVNAANAAIAKAIGGAV